MNVKDCLHCGKELPEELQFCPYCMNKLIEEKQIKPSIDKKPVFKKVVFIILVIAIFIIAGVIIRILLTETEKNPQSNSGQPPSIQGTDINNHDYIGFWENDEEDKNGIVQLEIITIKSDVMRFNLFVQSAGAYERVAMIENATGEIVDNVVSFRFQNDGWENAGTGKLKLSPEEIYVETTITENNPMANFSLQTSAYVRKPEYAPKDLYGYLETDYRNIRGWFGEEISDPGTDENTGDTEYYYNNLTLSVDEDYIIKSMAIDYIGMSNKSSYCYNGIDGNSTYEDVIAKFGQPVINTLEESGEVAYGTKNGFIKFIIDSNMQVTGFYCFSESSS